MKTYSIPKVSLIFFEKEDVITASGGDAGMDWDSENWLNEDGYFD